MVGFLSLVLGGIATVATGAPMAVTATGAFMLSFISQPTGVLMFAVQKEIWINEIVGNLFKDNAFLMNSLDHSQYVVNGKFVHIPQAGLPSKTSRNRTTLPASVTLRKDTDIYYLLDEYTTDPRLIENADKMELSYDKVSSVLSEDKASLSETIADWMLYHWRPETAEQMIRTTGGNVVGHIENATGNRKKLTLADFKNAKIALNKQGVSKMNRFALLDDEMFEQLCDELKANTTKDYSYVYDAKEGTLPRLEGFSIIVRATVLAATNASLPVVYRPDQTPGATANAVALFWQKECVARAVGETKMFDQTNNPQYYGDLYSFLQRMGGIKYRGDGKGVVGIVQAAA